MGARPEDLQATFCATLVDEWARSGVGHAVVARREGIAVSGDRIYLGLRGPVLRGWAFVLELRPYIDPDEPDRLRLHEFAEEGVAHVQLVLDPITVDTVRAVAATLDRLDG